MVRILGGSSSVALLEAPFASVTQISRRKEAVVGRQSGQADVVIDRITECLIPPLNARGVIGGSCKMSGRDVEGFTGGQVEGQPRRGTLSFAVDKRCWGLETVDTCSYTVVLQPDDEFISHKLCNDCSLFGGFQTQSPELESMSYVSTVVRSWYGVPNG